MPRVSLAFYTAASFCLLVGMLWGVKMGISQDFSLSPAHAHLNLLGWASLAIMGTFYALRREGGRLAWVNFALSASGAVIMCGFLALVLSGQPQAEAGVVVGSLMSILGLLVFLVSVLGGWTKKAAA